MGKNRVFWSQLNRLKLVSYKKYIFLAFDQAQDHAKQAETDRDIKFQSIYSKMTYNILTIYENYVFSVIFHLF